VLSSSRRRAILRYLKENPGPIEVDTLASVLAREGWVSAPGDDPERLRVAFEHVEFPVLTEAGLVEVDGQRESVERGEEFYQVTPFLNLYR
jgi:DNA-binding transcriptional ArsR family regulator